MKLPSYPRTKPSGVEWLGDVPEHWEVSRAATLGRFSSSGIDKKWVDGETPVQMFNYLDVYRSETKTLRYSEEVMWTTAEPEKIREHAVRTGDILVTPSSETEDDIGHAAHVVDPPANIVYSYHLVRFRISADCDSRYLVYSINAPSVRSYFESVCSGTTRMVLVRDDMRNARFALPPLAEQRAIAAFLDRETGRVDRLVAKKRELIERLKEKRTALISRTVTRGLPPAAGLREVAAFKDSGIPWLGKVPNHWSVLPFRRVTTRVDVGIAEAATHAYADEGIPLVRSTNIKFETVDTSDLLFIEEEFAARLQSKALRAGDIVTTRTGANLGVSAIIPKGLHMAQCFTLLISTLTPNCDPRFYNAFINADPGRTHFAMASLGAGQHNISVPILKEMPTVRPPLPEQAAIAAYLDLETAKLDALVGKVEEAVERLQEYRTALITAAVTGKIDVRGHPKSNRMTL